jgi:hypothetical protein
MRDLIAENLIPLDKSWIIRMGVLDLVNGRDDIKRFLDNEKFLGDDLLALRHAVSIWRTGEPVDVGESGTLYRFLQFVSWKLGPHKKFIKRGTLRDRKICDDSEIINWSLKKLLTLDHDTSQWASATVLCGNNEKIENPPYKLALTYKAVEHWIQRQSAGQHWEPRYDETILRQAEVFLKIKNGEHPAFDSQQAEDYCFARVFGYITSVEGLRRWPNLVGHESNRIEEVERELNNLDDGKPIMSRDHRVVQAIAMLCNIKNKKCQFLYSDSVNKSWPQFLGFLTLHSSLNCTRFHA